MGIRRILFLLSLYTSIDFNFVFFKKILNGLNNKRSVGFQNIIQYEYVNVFRFVIILVIGVSDNAYRSFGKTRFNKKRNNNHAHSSGIYCFNFSLCIHLASDRFILLFFLKENRCVLFSSGNKPHLLFLFI